MRSVLVILFFLFSAYSQASSWRNYLDPKGPLYSGNFASETVEDRASLKVITLNIKFAQNLPGIVNLLKTHEKLKGIDAILLQEVVGEPNKPRENSAEVIARELKLNYVFVPGFIHKQNGKDFGVAVLSPHPLMEPEKIILPHVHFMEKTQRVASGVTILAPNGPVRAYSIHAETMQLSYQRIDQAYAAMEAAMVYHEMPLIVGGDFNSSPMWQRKYLLNFVRNEGWQVATSKVSGPTFSGAGGLFKVRLDHIFTYGAKVLDAGKISGRKLSDHDFLWSELSY